jgi:hypothetical protein
MKRPSNAMQACALAWFLTVPVTPASLAAMGPLALLALVAAHPGRLRGLARRAEFERLVRQLDGEMPCWADGVAEAGDRALGIMAELEVFRRRLPDALPDTRALPTCGTQAFDRHGFAMRRAAPGVLPLRCRRP